MAEFLSDAWIGALDDAAGRVELAEELTLVVQQVVVDDAGGERAYVVRIAGGRASVEPGRADDADVVFTQDLPTAVAVARGEESAQAAFLAGRIRLGGDAQRLIERARELDALAGAFDEVRAATTW